MITDVGLIELAIHCKSMLTLNISSCDDITSNGIIQLAKHCNTSLTSLNITFNTNIINDINVTEIARHCTSLTSLDISFNTNITDISINEIAKNCINLIALEITACDKITDQCRTETCLLLPNLILGDIFRAKISNARFKHTIYDPLLWADKE